MPHKNNKNTQSFFKQVVPLSNDQLKNITGGTTDYQQLYNMAQTAQKENRESNGNSSFTPSNDGKTATVTNTKTGENKNITVNSDSSGINSAGVGNIESTQNPALSPAQQYAASKVTENGGNVTFPNGVSITSQQQYDNAQKAKQKNEATGKPGNINGNHVDSDTILDDLNLNGNGNLPNDFFDDISGNPTEPNEGKEHYLKQENEKIERLKKKFFNQSFFDYDSDPFTKNGKFATIKQKQFRDKTMQIYKNNPFFNDMYGQTDGKDNTFSGKGCKLECVSKVASDLLGYNYSIYDVSQNFDTNRDGLLSPKEIEKGLNGILPKGKKAVVNSYTSDLTPSLFENLSNQQNDTFVLAKADGVAGGNHWINTEGFYENTNGNIELDYLPSSVNDIYNNRKYSVFQNNNQNITGNNTFNVSEIQTITIF